MMQFLKMPLTFATLLLAVSMSGCAGLWQSRVIEQASFDHGCPEAQVRIVRDNGDNLARAVWVDVCGNQRLYRDLGGTQNFMFQDMTEAQDGR